MREGAPGTERIGGSGDRSVDSTHSDRTVRQLVESGSEDSTAAASTAAQTTNVAVLVSAPGQLTGGPIPSGAAATIRVGAYDDSGPAPVGVANESLDVTVTRPDATTENFSVQTGADGAATISYDLSQSNRGDGEYQFTVVDADATGVTATTSPRVGPVVTEPGGSDPFVFINESTTYSFLVLDGETGASDESVTLRVIRESDGTTVSSTSATTDTDGFATISYTPSQVGGYTVEAELPNGDVADYGVDAVERLVRGSFRLAAARVGETNTYGGYVETDAGYLTNTDIVVRFRSGTDILTEQTVTTDDSGFFLVDYDVPSGFSGDTLTVEVETTGGQPFPVVQNFVRVNDPSDGDSGPQGVVLTASTGSPAVPGETVTVDVEATDDGTAISGQDVDVFVRYRAGPPVYSTTVTTGSDGTATASTTLPNDAPDGHGLRVDVGMQYSGSTYTGSTGADIEQYDIAPDFVNVSPGATETYSIEVTERVTTDPVGGIPVQFNLAYSLGRAGSFGTGGLVSQSDGTDQESESIPSDVGFQTHSNYVHRYKNANFIFQVPADHPGSVGTSDTLVAGQDADFSFTTPVNNTVYGIAFATTPRPDPKTFGTRFQGPGTFTLSVPLQFSAGDDLFLSVWTIDGGGTLYSDRGFFTIDSGLISVSATAEDGVPAGGDATISVSAQQVETLTIEQLWTDWTLSSSNPGGGTVTDRISTAGELEISYGSVQGSVSPSVEVSLPSRYVGGSYGIVVTGSDSSGNTAEAMAVLTIA